MSDSGPSAAPGSLEADKWEWHNLIASKHGPPDPTTILVLLVLGLHMTQKGRCFPSQEHIAERSHLGVSTVRKHLKLAEAGRWLRIQRKRREGQAWYVNEYIATIPKELEGMLKSKPWEDSNGQRPPPGDARSARADDRHQVTAVERRRPPHNARRPLPGSATTATWWRDDRHQVATNLPSNYPMNISRNVLRTPGAIEIAPKESPEESQRRAEEEAKRLAEEEERERAAKAKKDAEAVERRRANVLIALKQWPDDTSAHIAKLSGSSVEEVEHLRRQA